MKKSIPINEGLSAMAVSKSISTRFFFILTMIAACSGQLYAGSTRDFCKKADVVGAVEASKLKSLSAIQKFHSRYSGCKNAALDEAYSEAISKYLDKNWGKFVKSKELKSPKIVLAIVSGVSDVWERKRFLRILAKAKKDCTPLAKVICAKIIALDQVEEPTVHSPEKSPPENSKDGQ